MKRLLLVAALGVSSCALAQPVTPGATLILKSQIQEGGHTMTDVPPYGKALVNHLILKLYTMPGEQYTGTQRTFYQADLNNPMVFSHLKANTSYRVKALAYFTGDESQLISTPDSTADFTVGSDDQPTIGSLNVKMIDRPFEGAATAPCMSFTEGGYSAVAPETLAFTGLEGVVSTFAGSGVAGSLDGTGTTAQFNAPCCVVFDAAGNLFVADRTGNRIRKVTQGGVVTTFVGNGLATSVDGAGTAASVNGPFGMVFDSSGDLILAELDSNRIRKITPAGVVTTFAGSGVSAWVDGTGTQAAFCKPAGLALDASGYLYVVEHVGNRIRKISPSGVVSTLAGNGSTGLIDGTGTMAAFTQPLSVALDSSGNLYVTDCENNCVRKITPSGVVKTYAGSGVRGYRDGQGSNAQFDQPRGIAIDKSGILFLVEHGNSNRIRKIGPNGVVTTLAGNGSGNQDGTGISARFQFPEGLCFDANGNLFVVDRENQNLRKVQ